MGLLYMADNEHDKYVEYIAEAAKLLGQECLLYQVDSKDIDIQNDKDIRYLEPVRINILLENNPTPILKKLNWYSEDDDLPYLAYLTVLDHEYNKVKISTDCIVEMSTRQCDKYTTNKFLITSVRGSKLNPLYWTCKLVPYRPKSNMEEVVDKEAPSNTDMGYRYVRRT